MYMYVLTNKVLNIIVNSEGFFFGKLIIYLLRLNVLIVLFSDEERIICLF